MHGGVIVGIANMCACQVVDNLGKGAVVPFTVADKDLCVGLGWIIQVGYDLPPVGQVRVVLPNPLQLAVCLLIISCELLQSSRLFGMEMVGQYSIIMDSQHVVTPHVIIPFQ